jgi:hypothetical protein
MIHLAARLLLYLLPQLAEPALLASSALWLPFKRSCPPPSFLLLLQHFQPALDGESLLVPLPFSSLERLLPWLSPAVKHARSSPSLSARPLLGVQLLERSF